VTQDIHSGPGDLAPGEQLAGYEIQERIGRGGMAVVYRALDLRLGRLVALKVLAPTLGEDEAFRQRFMRESRAAAGVEHPHIVPVFEAGEAAGGVLFIAMRYVAGGDVRSLIEAEGRLSPARTARIVSQVASALDAAHAHGLVHRDVKPANILLGRASGSDSDHVYLSDFGLSKHSLSSTTLTSTGQFLGTLDYVAPEQIQGHPVDGRADQYGLACAVVEMLTGAPPFRRDDSMALMWAQLEAEAPRVTERRPELPPAVDDVISVGMSKTPAGRYTTCADFALALAAACEPRISSWSGHAPAQIEPAQSDSVQTDPFPASSHQDDRNAAAFGAAAFGAEAVASLADRYAPTGPVAQPGASQTAQDPWSDMPGDWFRGGDPIQAPAQPSGHRGGDGRGDDPGPVHGEPFRQPSVHAAWPADPMATMNDVALPVTHPRQLRPGPGGRGRQSQHRTRNFLIGLVIAVVGVCGVAGIAYKLSHRTYRSLPPVTVYETVTPGAGLGPAQTVREYFAAINHRRYIEAWRLQGGAATEPYAKFRVGFVGTAHDSVTILSVANDVVTARLDALQSNGVLKVYQGTYTVTNGIITATNVQQIS